MEYLTAEEARELQYGPEGEDEAVLDEILMTVRYAAEEGRGYIYLTEHASDWVERKLIELGYILDRTEQQVSW